MPLSCDHCGGYDMKRLMLQTNALAAFSFWGAAVAADLPAPPPPPPVYAPVLIYNWTGFYLGGNIGGAWGDGTVTDVLGRSWSTSHNGLIGGGQVGFNY